MNDEPFDIGDSEPPQMYVYFIKLVSSEAIIAQSPNHADEINETGQVQLLGPLLVKKQYTQDAHGNINEMQLLSPWLEGTDLTTPVYIPIETVITITLLKQSLIDKYHRALIQCVVKDFIHDQDERNKELAKANEAVRKAKELGASSDDYPSIDPEMLANALKHANEERKADLVTPESLYADSVSGALEDIEDELAKEECADEPNLAYVKDGHTLH